jgi:hypothetical protein
MSVTTTNGNTALMSFIERAANNPEFDVAKFGELLRLQRDVGHDQARRAFNAAMADAQSEMLPVVRDAKNSHLGNRYARLETIDAAMRPIYTRHGFSVRFGSAPSPREGDIRIICTVAHSGGYFEENHLDAPLGTTGSQGGRTQTTPVQSVGSAVTYLRRYLLTMVFNIVLADDDDDGEGARRAAAAPTPRGERKMADAPETSRPRTRKDYLDGLEIALRDAQSAEEVDRIVCSEEALRAKAEFQNGHKTRLEKLIGDALKKWWHTPPDAAETPDDLHIEGEQYAAAG